MSAYPSPALHQLSLTTHSLSGWKNTSFGILEEEALRVVLMTVHRR
jgi:hypothetical protein